MKKSFFLATGLLLAASLVLAGCGKSTAEKAIEKASNGSVNVDVDNQTVTINMNGSTTQVGNEVDLPTDFPSDVYVVEGTIKGATKVAANNSFTVSIETTKSVSEAKTLYESNLGDDGWTITFSMNTGTGYSMTAEKDNRTATVVITDNNNGTTQIALNTANKE